VDIYLKAPTLSVGVSVKDDEEYSGEFGRLLPSSSNQEIIDLASKSVLKTR
jgi:hypothetical protein